MKNKDYVFCKIVNKEESSNIIYEDETLLRITKVSTEITKVIKKAFNPDGYTIMQNGGLFTDFGHYHMHVFPRYIDDEFGWTCKSIDNKKSLDAVKENLKVILQEL